MKTKVKVMLDHRLISTVVQPRAAEMTARKGAEKTRDRARENLTAAGRIRTGKLRKSIRARKKSVTATGVVTYTVGSDLDYASYQEFGIGPVHAKPGNVLVFKPKGSSVVIFRPRTSGFKGAHYLAKAYRALRLDDFL